MCTERVWECAPPPEIFRKKSSLTMKLPLCHSPHRPNPHNSNEVAVDSTCARAKESSPPGMVNGCIMKGLPEWPVEDNMVETSVAIKGVFCHLYNSDFPTQMTISSPHKAEVWLKPRKEPGEVVRPRSAPMSLSSRPAVRYGCPEVPPDPLPLPMTVPVACVPLGGIMPPDMAPPPKWCSIEVEAGLQHGVEGVHFAAKGLGHHGQELSHLLKNSLC
ncbi:hypothetical protein E2C01_018153 [Portunus trituberculatus]|uniref:Uncharacterized protein n=1 Tax=Portunus trituberculatus TaxID=210409 RepID=A0A5B7DUR5_PORTR|nr:hypothetical protein [Portunus trituberculatus]